MPWRVTFVPNKKLMTHEKIYFTPMHAVGSADC